ncbi:xylulokinase [Shimia gijangensis]|uniref:Xylulose kinase n=1 Tax=Shimia gijangensis TaxID=1470563 RepID=A0A1M6CKW8_9RHOB|nr:xylulokinase [Shimia gijangensis]SHI61650.1 xylulokinase [Shimia gijangensis]
MFIGLDLGTSGLRALLVDDDQQTIAVSEASYDTTHAHSGWSEQDPEDWVSASQKVLRDLRHRMPSQMGQLRGLGISGHMHGATLLDRDACVLRPCIMWNDTRSAVQAAKLDSFESVRDLSGNIVFPGFTAPKLAWVAENEPEIFAKVAKVLLPKDYLTFWLTGAFTSDMSDSAGTAWLDVGKRDWSKTLLAAGDMRQDQMPRLFEGTDLVGVIRSDLASELGLPSDVAVAAGAGDNAAAACGIGALSEGDGFVSLGTSGVLLAARDNFAPQPASAVHTFCHAVPGKWYQMGVILAATDSLNWLSRNLQQSPEQLTTLLGDTLGAPGTVHFLPYLSGERTPHNDSAIRGALIGLDISSNHADLTRAVIEGVSFALRDSLEALKSTGASLDSVFAIGGGSQSRYWLELVATVLETPLHLPEKGEFGAALGAARLAICGVTGQSPEVVMTKPQISTTIMPRTELTGRYQEAYAVYRNLYPSLKGLSS